jgi:hypothetical protein
VNEWVTYHNIGVVTVVLLAVYGALIFGSILIHSIAKSVRGDYHK